MSGSSPLDTLLLPLDRGDVAWHPETLFMGADFHESLNDAQVKPDIWQYFKPAADRLNAAGFPSAETMPTGKTYGLVLCLIPKQVEEAKFWIAQGLHTLEKGGILLAAAANDAGGSRLEKWFAEAGLINIQSESKNKARVVWGTKDTMTAAVDDWLVEGSVRLHNFGDLELSTQPGLFSWDRLDAASRLLVENFSPNMKGHGADFGCGYGYLAYSALKNHDKISSMTLVEADARALACAQKNLISVQGERAVTAIWTDAVKTVECPEPLDFILMNPPFHIGKNTDVDLGRGFIVTAAACLKKGGVLSMVANNYLPYEAILEPLFKNVKLVVQKNGFKVIRAVK